MTESQRATSADTGLPAARGTYVLVLRLPRRTTADLGAVRGLELARGWYLYVGSAFGPGGLAARVGRHLRADKRPRWHVDHLRALAAPVAVWASVSSARLEHRWAERLAAAGLAGIPRVGASDCRCATHLFFAPRAPDDALFAALGGSAARVWPCT